MRDKARHETALPIKPVRVGGRKRHRLSPRVALRFAGEAFVEPDAVENLHQREIEDIDPHDRLGAVVAVVVPRPVGCQDQVAARSLAAFAFDRRVAALVRQDRPAGIRRVNMDRCHIARIVDRHRAAHRAGDLQPPAEPRIGQQKLLALGKFDR